MCFICLPTSCHPIDMLDCVPSVNKSKCDCMMMPVNHILHGIVDLDMITLAKYNFHRSNFSL